MRWRIPVLVSLLACGASPVPFRPFPAPAVAKRPEVRTAVLLAGDSLRVTSTVTIPQQPDPLPLDSVTIVIPCPTVANLPQCRQRKLVPITPGTVVDVVMIPAPAPGSQFVGPVILTIWRKGHKLEARGEINYTRPIPPLTVAPSLSVRVDTIP